MCLVYKGRRKSKNNPKGMCSCCKEKIFNKYKNSLYCKDCGEIVRQFINRIYQSIRRIKKKYPDVNVKFKLTVTKE